MLHSFALAGSTASGIYQVTGGRLTEVLWILTKWMFFDTTLPWPNRLKAALLRAFDDAVEKALDSFVARRGDRGGDPARAHQQLLLRGPRARRPSRPVTAVIASTLSRLAPYFTARGPPALQARLPPMVLYPALRAALGT